MSLLTEIAMKNSPFVVCDHPTPYTDFNAAAYMGVWYEQNHTRDQIFQSNTDVCTTANYHDLTDEGHFVVDNTGQDENFGARKGITGDVYCPDKTGHCYVTFYTQPRIPNYIVVETDYESYSIVYACGGLESVLWLLTRDPVPSDDLYNYMLATAAEKVPHYDLSRLNTRDYQGPKCSYAKSAMEFLQ